MKRNPEFWDTLIKRLKAGERPEDLKVELGLGGVVDRYARHAGLRSARDFPQPVKVVVVKGRGLKPIPIRV